MVTVYSSFSYPLPVVANRPCLGLVYKNKFNYMKI